MQVPAGIPEGEHRVAVLALRHAAHAAGAHLHLPLSVAAGRDPVTVHSLRIAELHQRILSVHVFQDVGMDERMVEGGVEDGFLLLGAAGDPDAPQLLLPGLFGGGLQAGEIKAGLLRLQVLAGVVDAHEGHAHLNHHLLALGEILVAEPVADVIAGKLPGIGLVEFVASRIGIPGRLRGHRPLLLPVTAPLRRLAHAKDEVHREYGVPVVAERAHELAALDFRVGHPADRGPRFVGQAFAQVHEDVAGAAGEGVAFQGGAGRRRRLRPDAARKLQGVIARVGGFVLIFRPVLVIIYLQRTGGGHRQDRAQFRTAHAGEVDMGETGEVTVFLHVRSGPPAAVLVPGVEAGAHHVERRDAHQAVRRDGAGVARSEVGGTDEGVHIFHLRVQGSGHEKGRGKAFNTHNGWLCRF